MLDANTFMKGFLKYLQDYYGMDYEQARRATGFANVMKVPLFQERELFMEEAEFMNQMMAQDPMEQSGGMMGGDLFADDLNSMFPGPYDPVRM